MKPRFAEPIAEWYRYFAWKPVETLDRGWRWLWVVYRRKCQPHSYLPGPQTPFYQYRATNPELLKKEEL